MRRSASSRVPRPPTSTSECSFDYTISNTAGIEHRHCARRGRGPTRRHGDRLEHHHDSIIDNVGVHLDEFVHDDVTTDNLDHDLDEFDHDLVNDNIHAVNLDDNHNAAVDGTRHGRLVA